MAGPFVHEKFGAELGETRLNEFGVYFFRLVEHNMISAIGFLDKTDKWRLESRFFPSKVGGKPAWLDLKNLPPTEQLLCKFVLQNFIRNYNFSTYNIPRHNTQSHIQNQHNFYV